MATSKYSYIPEHIIKSHTNDRKTNKTKPAARRTLCKLCYFAKKKIYSKICVVSERERESYKKGVRVKVSNPTNMYNNANNNNINNR